MNADADAMDGGRTRRAARLLRDLLPYLGLILLVAYFSLASDFFFNARNFERLVTDSATLILVALGMTLVILVAEIDLSVGAVVALLSVILAQAMAAGLPWPVAVLLTVLAAMAIGTLNGVITVIGQIPSFIVTLGMMAIATGLAFIFTGAISVPILDETFLDLFYSVSLLGVPVPLMIVVVAFAALVVMLGRTAFGRELFAIGANIEAARLSGIAVRRNKIAVFAVMGLLVGVGAVLSASRLGSGAPGSSPSLTLDAIAAVIIGGASLFGGRASMVRTLLGALLIAVLNNGMVLLNVNVDSQFIVKGLIILLAVVLERLASAGGR
ncbi:MAG: ABC transporter permease [Roseitalea sp.]|jgi:ribose transport system permease protein|nr:ABC transporter permease [Roseitalea sp.]MBO6720321.1 ABC transporter permease [Roseitalea sp.]MBO6742681.1 ABC transporter permease [Roseitalea sp.]